MKVLTIIFIFLFHLNSFAVIYGQKSCFYGKDCGTPHPYVVGLGWQDQEGNTSCSAVKIAPRTILTAAHCIPFPEHRKNAEGTRTITKMIVNSIAADDDKRMDYIYSQVIEFSRWVFHKDVDLAILTTSQPVNNIPEAQICESLDTKAEVILSGWSQNRGFPEQELLIPQLNYGFSKVNTKKEIEPYFYTLGRGKKFWTYGDYAGVLKGDSGGPVLQKLNNNEACVAGINHLISQHNYIVYTRKTPNEHMHVNITQENIKNWVQKEVQLSESSD